jgi:hypothetical protein
VPLHNSKETLLAAVQAFLLSKQNKSRDSNDEILVNDDIEDEFYHVVVDCVP